MTIRMLISRILVPRGIRTGTTISLGEEAGAGASKRSATGAAVARIFSAGSATSLPYAGSGVAPPFHAGAEAGVEAGVRAGSGVVGVDGDGKRLGRAPAVAVAAATGMGFG